MSSTNFFLKMASTIGKYSIVSYTPLLQQKVCFIYCWWHKFREISSIVQRFYLSTNNIGYPPGPYDMGMKLRSSNFSLSFYQLHLAAMFDASLSGYRFLLHSFSAIKDRQKNATVNAVILWERIIELELSVLFTDLLWSKASRCFRAVFLQDNTISLISDYLKNISWKRRTTETLNSLLSDNAWWRPRKHLEDLPTTFAIH